MRIRAVAASLALVLTCGAATAYAKTSHAGWPKIDVLKMNKQDQERSLHGVAGLHNELLGGHGSDRIYGADKSDVIWGDYKPCCQPTSQVDRLYGRGGRDHIYASHGKNYIWGGTGNDKIHSHFGRGEVHCGRGYDIVFVSRKGRRGWRLYNCEHISYWTRGY